MTKLENALENARCASSCPPGWRFEVQKALKKLSKYAKISQIKSKFGQLRFYLDFEDGVPDGVRDNDLNIARDCENACNELCEKCGAKKDNYQHRPGSWITTLCRSCRLGI